MKQPLKEMLKKIGGGHLLTENKMVFYYMEHLGPYIQQLRPNIKGWKFTVDYMSGSWEWYNRKFEPVIYATWGWEGKDEIPIESSDGEVFKAAKLKLKPSISKAKVGKGVTADTTDEKQLKKDAIKYINVMKKEFPKIQKKILEY